MSTTGVAAEYVGNKLGLFHKEHFTVNGAPVYKQMNDGDSEGRDETGFQGMENKMVDPETISPFDTCLLILTAWFSHKLYKNICFS